MSRKIPIDLMMLDDAVAMLRLDQKAGKLDPSITKKALYLSGSGKCLAASATQSTLKIFDEDHAPKIIITFSGESVYVHVIVYERISGGFIKAVVGKGYPMPKETADTFITCRNTLIN